MAMSKTERTAKRIHAFGDGTHNSWDNEYNCIKDICRNIAKWHLRALSRARREERAIWEHARDPN